MVFTSSIIHVTVFGNKRISYGTFTNGAGDSGGNINTGLIYLDMVLLEYSGNAAVASAPSVNETFPCDGSAVTIVTTAGADGYWWAMGSE